MRCTGARNKFCRAFSLIEMVGVLTVVAILAALLAPRVFNAIHKAAITQTATSLNTLKTACVGHYAKFSCLATDGSSAPPTQIVLDGTDARSVQYDKMLLSEAFLDSVFSPKIGDRMLGASNTRVQIVAGLSSATAPDASNSAYCFDTSGNNEANGSMVVEAVITGVSIEDAKALNDLIDGPLLGEDGNGNDFAGRVKYGSSNSGSGSGSTGGSSNSGGNGNGNGLGNGNGNGGHNNGNGNGGSDNGNGNGGNGNGGNGNGGNGNGNGGNNNGGGNNGGGNNGGSSSQAVTTVTVHVYLTHR